MLKVDNISLYYGAAQALRGVSLSAEPGKVTCVLGRNGVGKTSLLRAMVGQYPISGGSIALEGNDITGLKPYERARAGIGFVPQGREIFPLLTVEENLRPASDRSSATTATSPTTCSRCFRCSIRCWDGAAATSPAGNNNNWRSAGRW